MKCKFWLLIIFSLLYFMTPYGFRDCIFVNEENEASKENCTDIILPNSECCFNGRSSCIIYYEDYEVNQKYTYFFNLLNDVDNLGYQEFIALLNSQNSEEILQCKTSNIKIDSSKISITEDQYNNVQGRYRCPMYSEFDLEDESLCFQSYILPELEKKGLECCYFEMQSKQKSSEIKRR